MLGEGKLKLGYLIGSHNVVLHCRGAGNLSYYGGNAKHDSKCFEFRFYRDVVVVIPIIVPILQSKDIAHQGSRLFSTITTTAITR